MVWRYKMDGNKDAQLDSIEFMPDFSVVRKNSTFINWTLYADNMTPKTGRFPFRKLQDF